MTTTENTRPGVWISVDAVGTDYVRISADILNDRLAAASRALAAVVNAPASPQVPAPESVRERREVRRVRTAVRVLLADEDACRRVDDVDQDGPDCEGPEGGELA